MDRLNKSPFVDFFAALDKLNLTYKMEPKGKLCLAFIYGDLTQHEFAELLFKFCLRPYHRYSTTFCEVGSPFSFNRNGTDRSGDYKIQHFNIMKRVSRKPLKIYFIAQQVIDDLKFLNVYCVDHKRYFVDSDLISFQIPDSIKATHNETTEAINKAFKEVLTKHKLYCVRVGDLMFIRKRF